MLDTGYWILTTQYSVLTTEVNAALKRLLKFEMLLPITAMAFTTTEMKLQPVAMADLCIEMESSTAAMT